MVEVSPFECLPPRRVLMASDVRLYRESLERVLREAHGIQLIGTVSCAEETLERVRALTPCVVLLDMTMYEAFSVARQLARIAKSTKVVALAMPEVEAEVINCAEIGIAGYVTREASPADVLDAIHAASRGEVQCSPKIAGYLFKRLALLSTERRGPGPFGNLTARESQIVRLLQQGLSNKMISRHLGIGVPTVKNHVHSILAKLGVHRRAEAVSLLSRLDDSESTDPHFFFEPARK